MINWHNPTTLRTAINDMGYSVARFAKLSGVSRIQLLRLIKGGSKPTWRTQQKIDAALALAKTSDDARKTAAAQSPEKAITKALGA